MFGCLDLSTLCKGGDFTSYSQTSVALGFLSVLAEFLEIKHLETQIRNVESLKLGTSKKVLSVFVGGKC